MATIKDLKGMAAGTEVKGLILCIKTARRPFRDGDGNVIQEVVFIDTTGEMLGHILLASNIAEDKFTRHHTGAAEYHVWQSKNNVCIMDAVIQDADERKKEAEKLFVTDCFDACLTISYDQGQDMSVEDWRKGREDEVKSKIRCWLVASYIEGHASSTGFAPTVSKERKGIINEWTEYVLTGE